MQIVSLNIADKTLSARKQGLREMRGGGRWKEAEGLFHKWNDDCSVAEKALF